jgi:hypothetical protein
VKEVISENEGLHEREKAGLLKSMFDSFEPGDEDDQEVEPEGKVGTGAASFRIFLAKTNSGKDELVNANRRDKSVILESYHTILSCIIKEVGINQI